MSNLIEIDSVLDGTIATNATTIDVRSPGEFQQGHIPGAINIPVFDDEQRAEIGTLFKQTGRQQAVVRGLEIVGAKSAGLLTTLESHDLANGCLVYCWRGGMRSEGFAWLLRGLEIPNQRLVGGYKSFRRAAHRSFEEPRRIIILGGATGSGKTKLLQTLREEGQQVIDLEGLACHRGSAFGGIGQPEQPTVEQFENELFLQWRALDPNQPVWLECESRGIGHVFIPEGVWNQMSAAPAIFLEVSPQERIEFLVQEYGQLPTDDLAVAMHKISKRLDGAKYKTAMTALGGNDIREFARVALEYYDRAYTRSLNKSPFDQRNTIKIGRAGDVAAMPMLIQMAEELTEQKAG